MNWSNRFSQLIFATLLFTLTNCTSVAQNSTSYPTIFAVSLTPTELPDAMAQTHTPTPDFNSVLLLTETQPPFEPTPIQLPINEGNYEGTYCNNPTVDSLSISDVQEITDDDMAVKLMISYLDYYKNPQAPDFCRIDGYRIERVFHHEGMTSQLVNQKGEFMRQVDFSIKLIQIPNHWMSIPGEIDQQNWLHISMALAIYWDKADSVYKMHIETGGG
ncbi:MAG: hypothetical protein IPN96_21815 [Anaerolineales bacterium]|nr:hypothetical protein [Anaerolineales bacterium]